MSTFASALNTLNTLKQLENNPDSPNITQVQCEETIDHSTFYLGFLIPAVLITLSFGFTKQRRQMFLDILDGRPGMVFPMDIITRDSSRSYAAAFGATLHLISLVISEQKTAFVSHGPDGLKSLVIITSMAIYGLVYFPVFACLAIRSTYGYIMGSLYIWLFTALSVYQVFQCANTYEQYIMWSLFGRNIPYLACLLYLCIGIPRRCYKALKTKKNIFETISEDYTSETLADIKESYVGRHVRKLLIKPAPKPEPRLPEDFKGKLRMKLKMFWNRWVYKRDDGFRYSSRFTSVVFVGMLLLYMSGFEALIWGIKFFPIVLSKVNRLISQSRENGSSDDKFLEFVNACYVSFVLAIVFTMGVSFISILHTMTSYRKNLKDLHKGIHSNIPAASERSNSRLLVGSMRYAGYQVSYIAWGFGIQSLVVFLILVVISILIIALKHGIDEWLMNILLLIWPFILTAVLIYVLQMLLAKFFFLQEKGAHLAFDNRRMLFCFTYFMFFYNIFVGFVSCLLRIVKAIVLGALLLSRLDSSTLPQKFQFFDPGFAAYVGFMHIENSHNHPVMLVLVKILLASRRRKQKSTSGREISFSNIEEGCTDGIGRSKLSDEEKQRRKAARFNWHVSYTLINNPELRLYRKGYLQALKKSTDGGSVVPVNFSTDIAGSNPPINDDRPRNPFVSDVKYKRFMENSLNL